MFKPDSEHFLDSRLYGVSKVDVFSPLLTLKTPKAAQQMREEKERLLTVSEMDPKCNPITLDNPVKDDA